MPLTPVNALEIVNLRKRYREVTALDGVSFTVAPREVVGLLGPNGAGKSTLMRCIVTLLRQDAGEVRVFGHDTLRAPREARRGLGYVAQQIALDKVLTGREFLHMEAAIYHVPRAEVGGAVARALALVGLQEAADKRLGTYSGGMARRLDLAAALLHKPALLILDEPTVGLDIHTRSALWQFIREMAAGGTAVLVASHHLEEIEYLADRIVIVDHGKVIAAGSSAELKTAFGKTTVRLKTAEFVAPDALAAQAAALQTSPLVAKLLTDAGDGGQLVVTLRDADAPPDQVRRDLAAHLGLAPAGFFQFSVERPTLDDVFLEATGRTLRDAPWAAEDKPAFERRRRT